MASQRPTSKGGRSYRARSASELIGGAMRSLGIPSMKVSDKLMQAWDATADDAWRHQTSLRRLEGGVLEVGVASDALRDELTNFHRERLLAVLRAALPDVPLVGIRFLTDEGGNRATSAGEPNA